MAELCPGSDHFIWLVDNFDLVRLVLTHNYYFWLVGALDLLWLVGSLDLFWLVAACSCLWLDSTRINFGLGQ